MRFLVIRSIKRLGLILAGSLAAVLLPACGVAPNDAYSLTVLNANPSIGQVFIGGTALPEVFSESYFGPKDILLKARLQPAVRGLFRAFGFSYEDTSTRDRQQDFYLLGPDIRFSIDNSHRLVTALFEWELNDEAVFQREDVVYYRSNASGRDAIYCLPVSAGAAAGAPTMLYEAPNPISRLELGDRRSAGSWLRLKEQRIYEDSIRVEARFYLLPMASPGQPPLNLYGLLGLSWTYNMAFGLAPNGNLFVGAYGRSSLTDSLELAVIEPSGAMLRHWSLAGIRGKDIYQDPGGDHILVETLSDSSIATPEGSLFRDDYLSNYLLVGVTMPGSLALVEGGIKGGSFCNPDLFAPLSGSKPREPVNRCGGFSPDSTARVLFYLVPRDDSSIPSSSYLVILEADGSTFWKRDLSENPLASARLFWAPDAKGIVYMDMTGTWWSLSLDAAASPVPLPARPWTSIPPPGFEGCFAHPLDAPGDPLVSPSGGWSLGYRSGPGPQDIYLAPAGNPAAGVALTGQEGAP